MFSFLKNLFKGSGSSFVGIDIGSSAIKVVQLKKKGGKAVLETYGSLALGPYVSKEIGQSVMLSDEKKIEAVKDILREADVTTSIAGIAIPFQSSLMSVVSMPTTDKKQLEEMVPLEARKYIPVPISEISLDWMTIPNRKPIEGEKEQSSTEILLVAIHNKVLNALRSLTERAQLDVRFFEIEIFSTIRSIVRGTSMPSLLFDMGAASTKLYFITEGVVHGSHTINRGSQDITAAISKTLGVSFAEAEKIKRGRGIVDRGYAQQMKEVLTITLGHIFVDTERAIQDFEEKYKQKIDKIYLVGGGSTLKGLKELAEKRLDRKVMSGDAFDKIETPQFINDVLKETGPEFAVAAGLALRGLDELGR